MNKLLITLGAVAALSAPASAADLAARPYTKAPPPLIEPSINWSGFYVGVNGGWEQTHATWISFGSAAATIATTNNSGTAGGQVGVLGQWGSFVAGAEVSYNGLFGGSTMNGSQPAFVGFNGQSKIDDLLLVTGKVGWAWNRSLFYAKGGYANADVKLNEVIGPPALPAFTTAATTSGRAGGWTAGIGWEYMFANNWSAGIEYDYARFGIGNRTYNLVPGFGCPAAVCGIRDANIDINMVTARLNYHFNWLQPVVAKY